MQVKAAIVLRLSTQELPDVPPTEFRLLAAGSNAYVKDGMTSPGEIILDEKGAAEILRRFSVAGRGKMAIDYDHATFNPQIQRKLAAGWFVPAIRDGELWATDVKWTKRAVNYITNKELLFYSPTVELDADGRALALRPVALTNDPALCNLRPLMASAITNQEEKQMKLLLKALELDESADEATALSAVQPMKDLKAQILALSGKANLADAVGAITAMKSQAERVETLSAELAAVKAEKTQVEITGLLDEAVKDGRVKPAKRDEFEQLAKSVGIAGLKTCLSMLTKASEPAVQAQEKPTAVAPVAQTNGDMAKILKATGLTAEQHAEYAVKYRKLLNPSEEA